MAAAKPQAGAGAGAGVALERFHFEVSGKVQGVFFRKHAAEQAARLGLTGWVQNTQRGTVVGEAEGAPAAMRDFRAWLSTVGSPKSRIDKASFSNEQSGDLRRAFQGFRVVREDAP